MALQSGTRLGCYEVIALLGRGGMGEVYRARDLERGRDVAVKVLPPGFAEDPRRIRRFEQEVRTLANLDQPAVVRIFDAGQHEDQRFLVMELLEGETLRQHLARGAVPWRQALAWALAAAEGLEAVHAQGIVHRDLKPENLFLTLDGGLKLLDFGLAKTLLGPGPEAAPASTLTTAGDLLGTLAYMSPEQIHGLPVDARSDLFALGAILFEMSTGTPPFARDSAAATLEAILEAPPPLERLRASPEHRGLEPLLSHCLEKQPRDRFQSAGDLAFALRSLLEGHPARPYRSRARRLSRTWAAALLAGAALAAGLGAVALWRFRGPAWDPQCVAILPFENRTGDPRLGALARQAPDLVRQGLRQVSGLRLTAEVPGDGQDRTGLLRAARDARARLVATGTLDLEGDRLVLHGTVVDPWKDQIVYALGPWAGPRGDPAPVLEAARQGLAGAVAWSFEDFGFNAGATRPPKLASFLAWREAMKHYGADFPGVAAILGRAVAQDPAFFWARYETFNAWQLIGHFGEAALVLQDMEADDRNCTPVERNQTRLSRAFLDGKRFEALKSFEELRTLHPDTPFIRINRAAFEMHVNRAAAAVRDLRGIRPDWSRLRLYTDCWPSLFLCHDLHVLQDYRGELRTAREARRLFPDILDLATCEAEALAALGRDRELEQVLDGMATISPRWDSWPLDQSLRIVLRELRAHGRDEEARKTALRFLAKYRELPEQEQRYDRLGLGEAEVVLGDLPAALAVFRSLAEDPQDSAAERDTSRVRQAWVLARLGRLEEARRLEETLEPITDPFAHGEMAYAHAGFAACLGEQARAVALLRQAFSQGLICDGYPFHHEPYLEGLRGYPPYEDLMKPKD